MLDALEVAIDVIEVGAVREWHKRKVVWFISNQTRDILTWNK